MPAHQLRILHIINSLDPRFGGTVECVRQVGGSVAASGHIVEVAVCQDIYSSPWLRDFPLKVHPLGPALGRYSYTPRLREWLKENGKHFDAWIINGLWQYQGLGASRVALSLGIPYFVYAHGMLDPWSRRASRSKYLKKFLYWLAFERVTMERAARMVFTSEEEAVLAKQYFPTADWNSIVVGNGISDPPTISGEDHAKFRARAGLRTDEGYYLFLSRIHPKKGIDLLLRAFAALPQPRPILVIAGDGDSDYVHSLRALGDSIGLGQSIRWTGPIYDGEKWAAFAGAELFVLPSHQENFGIAVVEALATGTPVCTTRAVNIHQTLEERRVGLICGDNQNELSTQLKAWQNLSGSEVAAYRIRARRCFEECFRVLGASKRLLSEIETVVAASAGKRGVQN